MIRVVMVAVIILVNASPAAAQEGRSVIGAGTVNSCGQWTSRSRSGGDILSQWVAGYLSGLNLKSDFDGVAGTDFNGLVAWIDNYCRSHPLDPVATAAFKLMDELQSRAQRR
jgi:hypothetical protein